MITKRFAGFLPALLLVVGCATAVSVTVPWPDPIPLSRPPVDLPDMGLRMIPADGWTVAFEDRFYHSWNGPLRATGTPVFRLVSADNYRYSLDELVTSAIRAEGVQVPADPSDRLVANIAGRESSGQLPILKTKIIAFAWQRGPRTFLLVMKWSDQIDGESCVAMAHSIVFSEPTPATP